MICMVENGTKSDRCRFCSSSFSVDILNKIKNDRDDVYCENCGDLIKRIQDKYNFNPNEIIENDSNTNITETPIKPQKDLVSHPDALNYPIGRVFYDTDFPPNFKSNFIIIFSRLICFHALYLEQKGQILLDEADIPENALNDLYMSTRHVQDKQIAPEFLTVLHDISKEDFEHNLKQMQAKIQSNRQYLEDFHVYSRWLIREVYLLISDGINKVNLPKFERTIYKDLENQKELFKSKLEQLIQGPINTTSYFLTGRNANIKRDNKYGQEETLVRRLVFTFLEDVLPDAPVTKIKETLRSYRISGHGARGITKKDLVRLTLDSISRESLTKEVFGWSTTSWTVFKSLAKYFTNLGQGFYTFSDRIFAKKFDNEGNHKGGKWRSDTIEQLIDLFETLQDNKISDAKNRVAILALRKYIQDRNLRNFQNILNKPEWVLTKALQKVFSSKYNRYISMDELSIMIFGKGNKGYFRNHFSQKQGEFKPINVRIIESFCRDNLDAKSMDLISTLIATWRKLRYDFAYGAPSTSDKQEDIDLINSIRESLEPLFNKPLNNLELGRFFKKKTLFTDVSNLNSKRKFKAKDIDSMLNVIRDKLIPLSVIHQGWDKAHIARDVLKELGEFRANFYIIEEVKMLIGQVAFGYDQDGYPLGWRSTRMRKLQFEILWLQQKGRCAISGKPIVLGRDRVARHHIEGIKSKSTLKDLVLVLDDNHGEIKKASVKQSWIKKLLEAKRFFRDGRPPDHWKDNRDKIAFRKAIYGWKIVDDIRTKYDFWRADLAYYW